MSRAIIDIWQGVLGKSEKDWETLVRKLAPLVYTVVHRCGLRGDDANDCAQQVWIDLYKGRSSIQDPQTLPAWLIRVASRKANRMMHRQIREKEAHRSLPTPSPVSPADEGLELLEHRTQLDLALEELDARCQRLLEAIFYSDQRRSYRQISIDLGIPFNSLGPTRTRCIKKLRRILTISETQ